VAVGDVNGDGFADLIAAPGKGPAQNVRVFDGTNAHAELFHFLPYGAKFTGGVFVAAGDADGDRRADVIVSPGAGIAATVQVISGQTQAVLESFSAEDPSFKGGVTVAVADVDGGGLADIVVGPGKGLAPVVRVFSGKDPALELESFVALDPGFAGGVFVG
jgi:hypothetical protein